MKVNSELAKKASQALLELESYYIGDGELPPPPDIAKAFSIINNFIDVVIFDLSGKEKK